ncbi:hypothetical protein [Empedobacter sp.]|uniref:hypothetical protein n=1 Tax=Empedobacter sp. TaxID=1927715 RepID=UPI002899F836|nr:hypothetical protein [Empedobacter sp.]
MIFVDTLSQLQINNLCGFEKPYSQPVIVASDINLQGRLPEQTWNDYTIEIKLYNCNGETFIKDVTDQFRIQFAKSIYKFRYFNLQLREWGNNFPTDCFTFKVEIKNNGQTIFNKITETYRRLHPNKRCYVEFEEIEWDNFSLGKSFIKLNSNLIIQNPSELPNHFESIYQQGTNKWQLYFDCSQISKIEILRSTALAFPLAGVLGGGTTKVLPIYAVYAVDENGCKLPISRLESTYECLDNITGLYYGDPKELLNYLGNDPDLKYSNSQWIESEIKKQPVDFQKEVSFLGRTQRVDYTSIFKFTGLIVFPQWKSDEIETVFSGKNVYLDSVEYVHKKGAIFKNDTIRNTCSWILDTVLEKKVIVNEFSCQEECSMLCYYFSIFGGTKDQAYYDENGKLIGFLYQDLLNYFNSLSGVISVEDFDVTKIECTPIAVIKIDTYGIVPSYIHYWEYSPTNRIYNRRDDCVSPNNLCDGIEGICTPPNTITSKCIIFESCFKPLGITSRCLDPLITKGNITLYDTWKLLNGFILEVDQLGNVTLNFTVYNEEITDSTIEWTSENFGYLSPDLRPIESLNFDDDITDITILNDGNIYYMSENLDFSKGYLSISINLKYNINGI